MGSHHQSLLLTRLMELRAQVTVLLMEHNTSLAAVLDNEDWVWKLANLADIFYKLDEEDQPLQGDRSLLHFWCECQTICF